MKLADVTRTTIWVVDYHSGDTCERREIMTDMLVAHAMDRKRIRSLHESDVIGSWPDWQQVAWAYGVLNDDSDGTWYSNLREYTTRERFEDVLLAERPQDLEGWVIK